MMWYANILILVITLNHNYEVHGFFKDLPSYYPRCFRDDPELNQCLLNATEQVKSYLINGVPELNMPSISLFIIPEISLEQGTQAINFKATLKNLEITGLDTYKFTRFDFDVEHLNFVGSVGIKQLFITGDYLLQGKILAVPLQGSGKIHLNVTNSNGTLTEHTKLVPRRGKLYLEPEKTTIKINVGEVKSHLDGLFKGNEQLSKATSRMINENYHELVEEVKPAVEEVVAKFIEDIISNSVAKVPYDKLYPLRNPEN